jgi:hypothetical protein
MDLPQVLCSQRQLQGGPLLREVSCGDENLSAPVMLVRSLGGQSEGAEACVSPAFWAVSAVTRE